MLNWKRRRAFGCPGFLRSTLRASRVRKPCCFSVFLSSAFTFTSARAMAKRSAWLWPVKPPPSRFALMSYFSVTSSSSSGCFTTYWSIADGKYSLSSLLFIVILPVPSVRYTRALAATYCIYHFHLFPLFILVNIDSFWLLCVVWMLCTVVYVQVVHQRAA